MQKVSGELWRSSVIYSEINKNTLTANIGQYPDRSVKGDSYLIKQALVYQKSATEEVQVHLIYSIKIDESLKSEHEHCLQF